jgi:hypothetical protein
MTEPNAVDLEQSACIIQGAVCVENPADPLFKKKWKENILNKNIHDIILGGAADHRQYPGLDKDISIPDAEYLDYKNRAGKEGFSIENPSTFFINHVYAAKARKFFPLNLESA